MPGIENWFGSRKEFERVNAAESILDDLIAGITNESLTVGSRLPSELALAKHYGVSRPVVREALRSAQALGLTKTKTGSGTFIISNTLTAPQNFDKFSTRDLLEARPAIEVPSAHYAASRHTPEQGIDLLHLCDLMDHEENPSRWVKLDSQFHVAVAAASGNQIFSSVVSDTRNALTQQSEMINIVAHRREPSNSEHRAIAEAIVRREGETAARLMSAHLSSVAAVLEPMIINVPTAPDSDG